MANVHKLPENYDRLKLVIDRIAEFKDESGFMVWCSTMGVSADDEPEAMKIEIEAAQLEKHLVANNIVDAKDYRAFVDMWYGSSAFQFVMTDVLNEVCKRTDTKPVYSQAKYAA